MADSGKTIMAENKPLQFRDQRALDFALSQLGTIQQNFLIEFITNIDAKGQNVKFSLVCNTCKNRREAFWSNLKRRTIRCNFCNPLKSKKTIAETGDSAAESALSPSAQ